MIALQGYGYGYGMMSGDYWIFGLIFWILVLIGIVLVIWGLFSRGRKQQQQQQQQVVIQGESGKKEFVLNVAGRMKGMLSFAVTVVSNLVNKIIRFLYLQNAPYTMRQVGVGQYSYYCLENK